MGLCIVCFFQLHDSGFSNKLLSMAPLVSLWTNLKAVWVKGQLHACR